MRRSAIDARVEPAKPHPGPALKLLITTLAAVFLASPTYADGDAELGKAVFNKCVACHDAKREVNRVGPHLVGVVGRAIGGLESFQGKYSGDLAAAGTAGMVWDKANLARYLRAPREMFPAGKMMFAGLKEDADIANVIAYLGADPKP